MAKDDTHARPGIALTLVPDLVASCDSHAIHTGGGKSSTERSAGNLDGDGGQTLPKADQS
jgi:hypothetical protein